MGEIRLVPEDEYRNVMSANVVDQVSAWFVIEVGEPPANQGKWGACEFRKIET